jgi:carbonic anhydrase/acetyltransferase-like protein (isoleucine patch superfamily)
VIHGYRGVTPKVYPAAFVEASAPVIGDVDLAGDASAWFNAVICGEVNYYVRIGRGTNIQDGRALDGPFSIIRIQHVPASCTVASGGPTVTDAETDVGVVQTNISSSPQSSPKRSRRHKARP